MSNNPLITLNSVTKQYLSPQAGKGSRQLVKALDRVSFDIFEQEVIGVIGPNGCGKTTLLRAIGGTLDIDKGLIKRQVMPRTIIELTQNLVYEATGVQNIFYFGAIIGIEKREIKAHLDSIIRFSGLAHVIQEPLSHYSSGMRMKLAYSVATMGNPKLICLDEIISVGDKNFSAKATKKFESLRKQKCTIILATHQLDNLVNIATRVIYIKNGKIIADGCPKKVIEQYKQSG